MPLRKARIEVSNAVFSLPYHVAREEGYFADEGYDVATASNGREALVYLKSHSAPRLILLDVMMPVMDGYEFRVEQQRDPAIADIPVVVLTAGSMGERVAAQRSRRFDSCTSMRKQASMRSSTASEMSRNWKVASARPGMTWGAFGSSMMRPVVQVLRSPRTRGNSLSTAASKRTAATPASLRSSMVVPPVWSCWPSKAISHWRTPTIPVTTPIRKPALSSWVPCSICSSKAPR